MTTAIAAPVTVRNRIDGELVPSSGGSTFEVHNPAAAKIITSIAPDSEPADVEAAITAAQSALAGWATTAAPVRASFLNKAAAILDQQADEVAREMVAEMGKPFADARNEVKRSAENLRLYAGEALRLQGTTFVTDDPTVSVMTMVDPIGVVGAITPWNFPLSLASRKLGPALAAGNTVVFKPSSMTPLMGERLAGSLEAAGLPRGVVNVVHGFGAGGLVVADERVRAITFTGSTAVGKKIHAALGLGRRAQLELGGNNPVVVLADADPKRAASVIVRSSFALSGQACTGAGRVIVEDGIHDQVLDLVAHAAAKLRVGPGLADGVDMGPLIDERAVDNMAAVVESALAAGARLVFGGRRLAGDPFDDGWFFPPTILADVTPDMDVSCTEVFGPVIGFERVGNVDEAIARANDTEYGLTAAICTGDLASAQRFARESQAGVVRINRPTIGTSLSAPFGGIKMSGTGTHKEQLGPTVMDFYTQQRTVFMGS
ncbi:MAG TPA: aldehyde dehydrogenase family protein [Acidimicrobiia bacterium]|nr:aldehyde dehydrogenase family protein [Acidimicrobiia bacterium]